MNKQILLLHKLVAAFSVALLSFSCSTDAIIDQTEISDTRVPITFTATTDAATRGSIISSADFTSFTLYAYEEGSNAPFIEGATFTLNSSGVWSSTSSYYWPTDTSTKIEFFAYTPAGAGADNGISFDRGVITYDMSSVENENLPDITVAYTIASQGTIALSFSRAVAFVQFKVKGGVSNTNSVESISIANIVDSGEYDITAKEWSLGSVSTSPYVAKINTEVAPSSTTSVLTTADGYVVVMPQVSTDVKFTVEVENMKSRDIVLSEVTWNASSIYSYTIDCDTFEFTEISTISLTIDGEAIGSELAMDTESTYQIDATVNQANNGSVSSATIESWKSDNESVATVSESGLITTYTTEGSATITVTASDGATYSFTVVVTTPYENQVPTSGLFNLDYYNAMGATVGKETFDADLLVAMESGVTTIKMYGSDLSHTAENIDIMCLEGVGYALTSRANSFIDLVVADDKLLTIDLSEVKTLGGTDSTLQKYAFYDCDNIERVILPSDIDELETYAFYGCDNLVAVEAESLVDINSYAFQNCTSLVEANYPNLTSVSTSVFAGCESLVTVELKSLPTVGTTTFSGCTSLETLILPSASQINTYFVEGCSALTTLKLTISQSSTITTYTNTFTSFSTESCTLYLNILQQANVYDNSSSDAVTADSDGRYLNKYFKSKLWAEVIFVDDEGNVVVPEPVTHDPSIGLFNLDEYSNDTTGNAAFEADFATAVANEVDYYKFTGAYSGADLILGGSSTYASQSYHSISDIDVSAVVDFSEVTNLTELPNYAFCNCDYVTEFILPSGITTVGQSAFFGCEILARLNLPSAVTLGQQFISSCYNLTELRLTSPDISSFPSTFIFTSSNCANCTLYLNSNKMDSLTSTKWSQYAFAKIIFMDGDEVVGYIEK